MELSKPVLKNGSIGPEITVLYMKLTTTVSISGPTWFRILLIFLKLNRTGYALIALFLFEPSQNWTLRKKFPGTALELSRIVKWSPFPKQLTIYLSIADPFPNNYDYYRLRNGFYRNSPRIYHTCNFLHHCRISYCFFTRRRLTVFWNFYGWRPAHTIPINFKSASLHGVLLKLINHTVWSDWSPGKVDETQVPRSLF